MVDCPWSEVLSRDAHEQVLSVRGFTALALGKLADADTHNNGWKSGRQSPVMVRLGKKTSLR